MKVRYFDYNELLSKVSHTTLKRTQDEGKRLVSCALTFLKLVRLTFPPPVQLLKVLQIEAQEHFTLIMVAHLHHVLLVPVIPGPSHKPCMYLCQTYMHSVTPSIGNGEQYAWRSPKLQIVLYSG